MENPVKLLGVLLIVVLIFGARKLPELGKGIGEAIREFRAGLAGSADEDPDLNERSDDPQT